MRTSFGSMKAGGVPLEKYWDKNLKLSSSNGYQIKPKQTQRDAKPLKVLPDLNGTDMFRFVVDVRQLDIFSQGDSHVGRGFTNETRISFGCIAGHSLS